MVTSAENIRELNQQAVVLTHQRQLDEAERLLLQACQLQPGDAETHTNLANVYVYQEKYDQAIAQFQESLRINPDQFRAHFILAIALHDKRRYDDAVFHFRHALRLNPNYAEAHYGLGLTYMELRRLAEAAACFQATLQLDSNHANAYSNLGTVLNWQQHFDAAITYYQQALRLNPQCPQTHFNLGKSLEEKGDVHLAEQCYRHALELNPQHAGACINLGNLCYANAKEDEALACFQECIRIKPDYAQAHANLGNVFGFQGRFDEALACYEQGVQLEPSLVGPHHNRAQIWLLLGRWAQGWNEYEWRCQMKDFPHHTLRQPRWDGSALSGRTLFVHSEQGLGDTLQFIRYLPRVREHGGDAILHCQPALRRLLSEALTEFRVYTDGEALPSFDFYIPLLSLPGIFGTTPDNVPSTIPYLRANPSLVEHWRKELEKSDEDLGSGRSFKIGIAWQGNSSYILDRCRSFHLRNFARLAQIEGVRLISLQKGPGTQQLAEMKSTFSVLDPGSQLDEATGPFMDTAAIMKNLDLVITSDTAVAHLAGALGVPVWVALPFVPDWRWLLQREDTPWYPTMRLFRQTKSGDWDDVFQRIAEALRREVISTK